MKSTIYNYILAFSIVIGLCAGCDNPEKFDNSSANLIQTTELQTTVTVAAVKAQSTASAQLYTNDDVIEAYVTSSDRESNFYNSISLQDISTTTPQPIGFSVTANLSAFQHGFTPGRKVYIKLKGLYTAVVDGSLKIGALFEGEVGRISENDWQNHLFPSATIVDENSFVRELTLAQAATENNLNTLIELKNVELTEDSLGRTYFDVNSGGGATNHNITSIDNTNPVDLEDQPVLRISSFSAFSTHPIAEGSGTIRGVMTKYQSTYQFLVRDENDIKLNGMRVSIHAPLGGTAVTFTGSYTEPFTSYALNERVFPKYVNDQTLGGRYWQVKQFPSGTGNKYIEMTSFGGGGVNAKTYFFVPADFTAASTFTFKKEIRYNQGSVLKVYYVKSADYTASGPIDRTKFVDITSSFSITYPAIGSSDNSFSTAGNYAIPASLTGTGFFIFEYSGTPTVTTTIQLDDITLN